MRRLGAADTTVKTLQLSQVSLWGMMAQARPATVMFPIIQKEANTLSAPPLLLLGWNSAKYVQTRGILPPTLSQVR